MAELKIHKVTALPSSLEKSSIYLVKSNLKFDMFVTNESGFVEAFPMNFPEIPKIPEIPDVSNKVNGVGITSIRSLTQSEYDSILIKDSTTIYFVREDEVNPPNYTEIVNFAFNLLTPVDGFLGEDLGNISELLGENREPFTYPNEYLAISRDGASVNDTVLDLDAPESYDEVVSFKNVILTKDTLPGVVVTEIQELLGLDRIVTVDTSTKNYVIDSSTQANTIIGDISYSPSYNEIVNFRTNAPAIVNFRANTVVTDIEELKGLNRPVKTEVVNLGNISYDTKGRVIYD